MDNKEFLKLRAEALKKAKEEKVEATVIKGIPDDDVTILEETKE